MKPRVARSNAGGLRSSLKRSSCLRLLFVSCHADCLQKSESARQLVKETYQAKDMQTKFGR